MAVDCQRAFRSGLACTRTGRHRCATILANGWRWLAPRQQMAKLGSQTMREYLRAVVNPTAARRRVLTEMRRVRTLMTNRVRGINTPKRDRRWRSYNLGSQNSGSWHARAEAAVSLWCANPVASPPATGSKLRVADLGAGNERLRDVIEHRMPEGVHYHAYDLLPQQPSTTRIDLLQGPPEERFDLIFCLGLLEYIPTDNTLIARLYERCDAIVVSYVFLGSAHGSSLAARQALNWVRSQDRAEFEADFTRAGFHPRAFVLTNEGQTGLWLWARTPAGSEVSDR